MVPKCTATTAKGIPCTARPVRGSKLCNFHTPGRVQQIGSIGGRRRRIFNPDNLQEFGPPKTAGELKDILAMCIVELRGGKIDPRIAACIGQTGATWLRAYEFSALEDRMTALEKGHRELRNLASTS